MKSNLFLVFTILAVGIAWFFLDPQLNSKNTQDPPADRGQSSFDDGASQTPQSATDQGSAMIPPADKSGDASRGLPSDLELEYQQLSENDKYPTLASRMQGIAARRGENRFTAKEVVQAMQVPHAWEQLDSIPESFQEEQDIAELGRQFIRFSSQKIETLMPGDKMDIPIPEVESNYEMKVISVETHPGGSVTWTGRLVGYPSSNVVHITQSENITVGGIETPNGNFQLHAKEGVGWIASSSSMYKQSYGTSDAVVPPKP